MCQEAEDAKPVAHGDDDDAARRHALAIVARFRAIAGREAATIEVDQHRPARACTCRWHPHVEVQAVLARPRVAEDHVVEDATLHALCGEAIGRARATPFGRRLRRLPAQIAHGRRGERNPAEDVDSARGHDAAHGTILRANHRRSVPYAHALRRDTERAQRVANPAEHEESDKPSHRHGHGLVLCWLGAAPHATHHETSIRSGLTS
jgi:hypothetical protein